MVAVGAIAEDLKRLSISSTGRELEFVAPGANIQGSLINNTEGTMSGTSMAAAFVTGAFALIWEKNNSMTNVQVRESARISAIELGPQEEYGYGLISPEGAIYE